MEVWCEDDTAKKLTVGEARWSYPEAALDFRTCQRGERHGGALDGIRVLDFSRVFAGPAATQVLGDLGADVIKVEEPKRGDEARYLGVTDDELQKFGGVSPSFLALNRNKRSHHARSRVAGRPQGRARDGREMRRDRAQFPHRRDGEMGPRLRRRSRRSIRA